MLEMEEPDYQAMTATSCISRKSFNPKSFLAEAVEDPEFLGLASAA